MEQSEIEDYGTCPCDSIANGGQWEDSFEPFCWWSFHYAMWVKMNLFYQQASEAFGQEELTLTISIK
ncbi:MAG: hypothetical protein MJZ29_00530 [Bacteroidaceae bacterium]|nr:hypothetical protein [Bacteroidaceae bacterium]